jgi:hypothetical protein
MAIHRDDQLIVARPDLDVVTGALADLGMRWGRIDTSAALALGAQPGRKLPGRKSRSSGLHPNPRRGSHC